VLRVTAHPPKPSVRNVLPLVLAYYAKPGNLAGGSLHLVLDDGNVDDDSVQYCLHHARAAGDVDGVALASTLAKMSRSQRRRLLSIAGEA